MQTTLKNTVVFDGIGLHTGRQVRMTIRPAPAEYGIWFRRTDVRIRDAMIPARWHAVTPSELCTKISNAHAVTVSTIEHIMAAIAGTGLTNAIIDIDGPEVPILDGSSAAFVRGILDAGLLEQDAPAYAIEILETVEVKNGPARARLEPAAMLEIDFAIDFEDAAIGQQQMTLSMANGAFVRELCSSRTFCRNEDVEAMRARGLVRGGSLDNAVVVEGAKILTPGGFRHSDEPVRHKMLDAMGDLALAGAPILGRYAGNRAGHALTNALLRTLFARPEAYRMVECDGVRAAQLPGAGVTRRDTAALAA